MNTSTIKLGHAENKAVFKAFLAAAFLALIIFLPFSIEDGGYFSIRSDFNEQQIPFNIYCNRAIKAGETNWCYETDIGSPFIGQFAFYNIGSPFFWLYMLFRPEAFYIISPILLVLKYAVAAGLAAVYFKRFLKNERAIIFGSLLYAFSSYQCINLLFNHFHDVTALFPLMLIGIEMLIVEKKRGPLLFAAAINCLCNYFFFVGEAVFLLIYYLIRFLIPALKEKKPAREKCREQLMNIFNCAIEGLMGIGISAILLLPSIYLLSGNSRSKMLNFDKYAKAKDYLLFGFQRYLIYFKAMLLPADTPWNEATKVRQYFSSIAMWLPMTGLFFVLLFFFNRKRTARNTKDYENNKFISRILLISAIFASVPVLNSAFVLFTQDHYGRWLYMPLLIASMASAKFYENLIERNPRSIRKMHVTVPELIVGTLYFLQLLLYSCFNFTDYDGDNMINQSKYFSFLNIIAFFGFLISYAFVRSKAAFSPDKSNLKLNARVESLRISAKVLFIGFLLISVIVPSSAYIYLGRKTYNQYYGDAKILRNAPNALNYLTELNNDEFVRCDNVNMVQRNLPIMAKQGGVVGFTSTVNRGVFQFNKLLGHNRTVNSYYDQPGVKEFLSTKYLISNYDLNQEYCYMNLSEAFKIEGDAVKRDSLYIYRYIDALPFGINYNEYIEEEDFKKIPYYQRGHALLEALPVRAEDLPEFADCLVEKTPEEMQLTDIDFRDSAVNGDTDMVAKLRSETGKHLNKRKEAKGGLDFIREKDGYRITIEAEKPCVTVISIAYDEGWKAYKLSEDAESEDVKIYNIAGLTAIKSEKGIHSYSFKFRERGRDTGLIVSVLSLLTAILYTLYFKYHDEIKAAAAKNSGDKKGGGKAPESKEEFAKRNEQLIEDFELAKTAKISEKEEESERKSL